MTEHEKTVVCILETRKKIVRNILSQGTFTPSGRSYYEGKAEGYAQAIDLLKGSDTSAGIELEKPLHK